MPGPRERRPAGAGPRQGRGILSPMSPTLACAPPHPRQAKTACVFSRRDTANRPNGSATTMTGASSVSCHRPRWAITWPRLIAP